MYLIVTKVSRDYVHIKEDAMFIYFILKISGFNEARIVTLSSKIIA
jgi:hypothetical protein